MSDILLVFCTFPDAEQARLVGRILVEEHLAACVNLIPGIESIYHWQGAVESSAEIMAVFKTTQAAFPAMESRIKTLHSYELPEIIALKPSQLSEEYAGWVRASVLVGRLG